MNDKNMWLDVPNHNFRLRPGNRVQLSRFDSVVWVVSFGWYTWGGNRPTCGWYLTKLEDPNTVKPLSLPDLDDIYIIES